jgi:hypothetical protein
MSADDRQGTGPTGRNVRYEYRVCCVPKIGAIRRATRQAPLLHPVGWDGVNFGGGRVRAQ